VLQLALDAAGAPRRLSGPRAWDYVITVCDSANESCPIFPAAAQRLHWSFPDPSLASGSEEERLRVSRQVGDARADRIKEWLHRS
jgi:arsenate reductase